jgi:hypothetical protein
MQYKEPVSGTTCEFTLIPMDKLINSPYQRERSSALVRSLLKSVAYAFISPLIVVEEEDKYIVIDGQHRIEALMGAIQDLKALIPCIVLPHAFKTLPLLYNIEKADNVKDKCRKVYAVYMDVVNKLGTQKDEKDARDCFLGDSALITMAFAHMEKGLASPSLVESTVRKLDKGILKDITLDGAIDIRRQYGAAVAMLEQTVNEAANVFGVTDYNLKKAMISQTSSSLWGKARSIDSPFEDGIEELIAAIDERDWSWMARR